MGMQIEKSFVVNAPFQAVWEFLIDPKRVAGCLPGAAITDQIDEKTWGGTMTVKVGPVTAAYRGKLRFERLDPTAGEAEMSGAAQETRGKGGADMRMKSRVVERSPGETEVTVTSDVNVMGVLAQFGRGMIQDVSDQLFQKFSEAMRRELEIPAVVPNPDSAPVAPPAPAPPREEVLDVGALGTAAAGRAAGRMLQRPAFWIVIIALALILYWFLRQG
jgi:hypothetical protein